MALACVEALEESAEAQAQELARIWGVPLRKDYSGRTGIKVLVSDLAVGLGFVDPKRGKPYYVDFLTQAWRTRFSNGLPRGHIFSRALGFKGQPLSVIDATAGFGQDAVLAITLGCEVIAVEQSSVVVTVLRNGVTRAMREDKAIANRLERLSVVEADARKFLESGVTADVIYLDPMFSKPKKKAKSPKEMQLLQELFDVTPAAPDSEESLFNEAIKRARQRVVVKRPLKSRALGRAPNHSFKGQSIRYDVYLTV
jgi:16S rRNA (guanine1516-N2)-methyltransferase